MSIVDDAKTVLIQLPCISDADCPIGYECKSGDCTPPPPFDWMQIGLLAVLGIAAVLVIAGVTTIKD